MTMQRVENAADLAQSALGLTAAALKQPQRAWAESLTIGHKMLASVAGCATSAPAKGDKRFRDPVWGSNPAYRALMQSYLAWSTGVAAYVDGLDVPARDRLRARIATDLVTDALAPTNALLTNPAAMKVTLEQGGRNLVTGARQFVRDMTGNGGLPAMVDKTKFAVGENLALTPGRVVYAEDHLELIEYAPQTETVRERPIFIVPPQINKFYIWDLAPGRSIVEPLVAQGHRVFIVSWKNPGEAEAHWTLESYVEALDRATAVACEIAGSPDLNLVGACSGGITAALLAALWGARGVDRAASLSLFVAILDVSGAKDTAMGLFASFETLELARTFSRSKGVLAGKDLERAFAWLRPNDLIWNYWVNNYLIGEPPAAFDILYWNADTTNLPAALHSDMLRLIETGGVTGDGGPTICGHRLSLEQITCDTYLMGGESDHITPWDGCYLTRAGLGGASTFVLSQSGHVQSLINPPGNPKARFLTNDGDHATPDAFLAGAETHAGSWWPHWHGWLDARGGERVPAPADTRRSLGAAPGAYVRAAA
ncbi:MAG TPA: alpha/beta fold hydrolase [Amaricoccus sp.]|nr:alpha/beta fold hydrolase [Amaricoccus sp.]